MKSDSIVRLLPGVFQRTCLPGTPLAALLDAMETLHRPAEAVLSQWDARLDPRRTTDDFVPFLAGWLDLDDLLEPNLPGDEGRPPFPPGLGRLRELICSAALLARGRGTSNGLLMFLETATGEPGFVIEEAFMGKVLRSYSEYRSGERSFVTEEFGPASGGPPQAFHLRLYAPPSAETYRELIRRIVDREKPAFVTYELQFGPPPEGV